MRYRDYTQSLIEMQLSAGIKIERRTQESSAPFCCNNGERCSLLIMLVNGRRLNRGAKFLISCTSARLHYHESHVKLSALEDLVLIPQFYHQSRPEMQALCLWYSMWHMTTAVLEKRLTMLEKEVRSLRAVVLPRAPLASQIDTTSAYFKKLPRGVQAGLRDIVAGRVSGPFNTVEELIADLES